MNEAQQAIETMRGRFDQQIMATEGVVSVGTGLSEDGQPCLVIGTSGPVDAVRARLPQEIFDVCVEIRHVGDIEAQ